MDSFANTKPKQVAPPPKKVDAKMPLDIVAIAGYMILNVFAIYMLSYTYTRKVDVFANLLLVTGFTALLVYHFVSVTKKVDETKTEAQRRTRLIAHSTIVGFFLLTLLSVSQANFQYYDWFGLLGHLTLFVSVFARMSQVLGIAFLAIYYPLAAIQKLGVFQKNMAEILQFVGRILLSVFFIGTLVTKLV